MELNNNKKLESTTNRFAEIQRGTEARTDELRETVERVRTAATEMRGRSETIGHRSDSIDLSSAAQKGVGTGDEARLEHVEKLRAATADGSLFNQDRLARAAERLLAGE